jgi:hypothetical protein
MFSAFGERKNLEAWGRDERAGLSRHARWDTDYPKVCLLNRRLPNPHLLTRHANSFLKTTIFRMRSWPDG